MSSDYITVSKISPLMALTYLVAARARVKANEISTTFRLRALSAPSRAWSGASSMSFFGSYATSSSNSIPTLEEWGSADRDRVGTEAQRLTSVGCTVNFSVTSSLNAKEIQNTIKSQSSIFLTSFKTAALAAGYTDSDINSATLSNVLYRIVMCCIVLSYSMFVFYLHLSLLFFFASLYPTSSLLIYSTLPL